jgi:hypothetical protein
MRVIFFRLFLVGAMSFVAPLAHPQLLTHRDLSYSMAKTIAETAIDSCAAKGYAVSAVVAGALARLHGRRDAGLVGDRPPDVECDLPSTTVAMHPTNRLQGSANRGGGRRLRPQHPEILTVSMVCFDCHCGFHR